MAKLRAAAVQIKIFLVLRRFPSGDKTFPLLHLAQNKKRGEAAKIENPAGWRVVDCVSICCANNTNPGTISNIAYADLRN
jgi:hypothetical protein